MGQWDTYFGVHGTYSGVHRSFSGVHETFSGVHGIFLGVPGTYYGPFIGYTCLVGIYKKGIACKVIYASITFNRRSNFRKIGFEMSI